MKKITIDIDGIQRDVLAADLHTVKGTSELENILMTRYPARDVAVFAGLANQYQSTPDAVRNFRTMFARVMRRYETYLVLAADMGLYDSRRDGACLHVDDCETEPNLIDYPIAAIVRKVEAARKKQGNVIAAIEADGDATRSLIRAHFPNRPADHQVTQEQLSQMLAAKNCPKDRKTIQRWEKYLQTDGKEGSKPPAGYTLQTRLTPQTAAAWVDFYTAKDNARQKTKISFDTLFGRT